MKKNIKKGFTLVEILGVIVVVGLLTAIATPNIINNLNKNRSDVSNVQNTTLVDSAEEFFTKNDENYRKISNKKYCVSLKTLQDEGLLSDEIYDATTGKKYDVSSTYVVGKSGINPQDIKYEISSSCTEGVNTCTVSYSNAGKITYYGLSGSPVSKDEFISNCNFPNGIDIVSSPSGWSKEKEVKITYTGSDLTNRDKIIKAISEKGPTKISDNLYIYTAIINENQTILATSDRIENGNVQKIAKAYEEKNIDNLAPTCTFTMSGRYNSSTGWFYGINPTLTITASDDKSGLNNAGIIDENNKLIKNLKMNGTLNDTVNYQIKGSISSGKYKAYATDRAGNNGKDSKTCNLTFNGNEITELKVDLDKPTVNVKFENNGKDVTDDVKNGKWFTSTLIRKLSGEDKTSGISKYLLNENGSWMDVNATESLSNVNNKEKYKSVDNAGNESDESDVYYPRVEIAPTLSISSSSSTNTIRVSANVNASSGVSKYEFSIDNGNYISSTNNNYNFTGLSSGSSYKIKIKITTNAGNTVEKTSTISTDSISRPTFSGSGSSVTINFNNNCNSLTCQYKKGSGSYSTTSSRTVSVSSLSDGQTVTAYVTDGNNSRSNSYTYIKPSGGSSGGSSSGSSGGSSSGSSGSSSECPPMTSPVVTQGRDDTVADDNNDKYGSRKGLKHAYVNISFNRCCGSKYTCQVILNGTVLPYNVTSSSYSSGGFIKNEDEVTARISDGKTTLYGNKLKVK